LELCRFVDEMRLVVGLAADDMLLQQQFMSGRRVERGNLFAHGGFRVGGAGRILGRVAPEVFVTLSGLGGSSTTARLKPGGTWPRSISWLINLAFCGLYHAEFQKSHALQNIQRAFLIGGL